VVQTLPTSPFHRHAERTARVSPIGRTASKGQIDTPAEVGPDAVRSIDVRILGLVF